MGINKNKDIFKNNFFVCVKQKAQNSIFSL